MSGHDAAAIRARLGHPIVDIDGHIVESIALVVDYMRRVAGDDVADRFGYAVPSFASRDDALLARVQDIPPADRLVVCHGDACAPNTLVGDDGSCIGHVDLGRLGVADRWADLAVATWSTVWNYGPGYEDLLLAKYGIAPDPECTAFYRRLWDLGSGPEHDPQGRTPRKGAQ